MHIGGEQKGRATDYAHRRQRRRLNDVALHKKSTSGANAELAFGIDALLVTPTPPPRSDTDVDVEAEVDTDVVGSGNCILLG